MAILRPTTFTVTVTTSSISDGNNICHEIVVDSDGRDGIMEWLKENNSHDGFLVIADVDGDVFSYKAEMLNNVEIMRDLP